MQEIVETLHGKLDKALLDKLRNIELVIFDVDGTLTDGCIYLDNMGNEQKCFDVKDGLGIGLLSKCGIASAVITGKNTKIVARRCEQMNVKYIYQGAEDKEQAVLDLKSRLGNSIKCAGIGDDLNDIPMLKHCEIKACPQDANTYIKNISDFVMSKNGGHGAVREFIDLLLIAKGFMNKDGSLINSKHYITKRQ